MRQVWKFPFSAAREQFQWPRGGKVLHVDHQDGVPTLWVLVDDDPNRDGDDIREFVIVPTGAELHRHATTHIGSLLVGPLVFHVFEVE